MFLQHLSLQTELLQHWGTAEVWGIDPDQIKTTLLPYQKCAQKAEGQRKSATAQRDVVIALK